MTSLVNHSSEPTRNWRQNRDFVTIAHRSFAGDGFAVAPHATVCDDVCECRAIPTDCFGKDFVDG
jgi:hypothetical protein